MSRAQQGQILDTATATNKTDTERSQTALDTAQQDINTYGGAVNKFAAANPYVEGGQAETATNQMAADTAAGMAQSAGQGIQSAAVRTGQNAGGAIAATEEMQQANERALVGQEAKATEDRLASGSTYQDAVMADRARQQGMQEQLGAEQGTLAQGALNTGEEAAKTPSFMDELGQGLISAGTSFAGGFGKALGDNMCPAEGSAILMADFTRRPIDLLKKGDRILGIDREPQEITEIETAVVPVLIVTLDNHLMTRNSKSHAFALPFGGFIEASKSLGRAVLTRKGSARVVGIEPSGTARVYSLITDGSHTYQADGVWALGAGDDEHLSAETEELEAVNHGR